MRVAIGYNWFETAAGYHLERAFRALGHEVTYVGLGVTGRPGYTEVAAIDAIIAEFPAAAEFYLWIDPAGHYFPDGIESLPIPSACYLIDVHLGHWREEVARFFDVVFVAQKDFVSRIRRIVNHDQVYWLPLAAADDVHYDHQVARSLDIGFVGNISRAHRATARQRRLSMLSGMFRMNDPYGQYSPLEVGSTYSQSKIVFNTSIAGDVTMRIFEGTACGALMLTDAVKNGLTDLYVPNEEIVVFENDDDLVNKVRFYLAHDNEREKIADAGKRRTLAQHTYRHRVQTITDKMSSSDLQCLAPMRVASPSERNIARRSIYTHLHMLDALFDLERKSGSNSALRLWRALPCLARRVLL